MIVSRVKRIRRKLAMADQDDGEQTSTDMIPLPDLRRIEPLLKHLPQIRENLTKVMARIFGSPKRTRSMAGARTTADAAHEVQMAQSVVLRAAAERAASAVSSGDNPELALRAITRLGEEAVRTQLNVERTLSIGFDEASSLIGQEDAEGEVSDDWIDRWIRLAETMSDEDVQRIYARILIGEACQPGSYSPLTLHTLSIMTRSLAKTFERLCNLSIANLDRFPHVVLVDGDDLAQPLGAYGLSYDDLLSLQSSGFIASVTGSAFTFEEDVPAIEINYAGRHATIEAHKGMLSGLMPSVSFSQAGAEIRQQIALKPDSKFTVELTRFFDQIKLKFVVMN